MAVGRAREAETFIPQPPEASGEERVVLVEKVGSELIDDDPHHQSGPIDGDAITALRREGDQ
jgi:hypothetical protein